MLEDRFWEKKKLDDLNREEWEALCDGCARCCLYKIQDEETNEVFYTTIVCRLLNLKNCRCTDYANRSVLMPTCLTLDTNLSRQLSWMPSTCAYRRLAEGKPLAWWHPLISKNPETVHFAGISIRDRAIPDDQIDLDQDLEDYIIEWID